MCKLIPDLHLPVCTALSAQELTRRGVRALMLDPALSITIPDKADRRYALCAAMIYYLWHGQTAKEQQKLLDGFFRISLCLPSDFAAMTMTDAMRARKGGAEILYKHPQYQEWLKRHGKAFARRR